jgi:hypothetical protein
VVLVHLHPVEQLVYEHAPFLLGGGFPDRGHVDLGQVGGDCFKSLAHLFDAHDVLGNGGFFGAQGVDLSREPGLLFGE